MNDIIDSLTLLSSSSKKATLPPTSVKTLHGLSIKHHLFSVSTRQQPSQTITIKPGQFTIYSGPKNSFIITGIQINSTSFSR
jgi:hypothetical protein